MKKTKIIALFLVLAMVLTSTVFIVSAEDSENAALNDALKEYYGDTDFELHIHDDSCCSFDADFDNFDNWEDFNSKDFTAIQIDDSGDTYLFYKDYVAEVGENKLKDIAEGLRSAMINVENDEQVSGETEYEIHIKGSPLGISITNVSCNSSIFLPCMADLSSMYTCAYPGHVGCVIITSITRGPVRCNNGSHSLL